MNKQNPQTQTLPADGWRPILGEVLLETVAKEGRALLCLAGKTGCGKTTIAREIRKTGLPGLRPPQIAVIDDGVMTAPLFGLLNRRIRFPADGRDELAPFEPYLKSKKLVVYVAIRPQDRISRCHVLVRAYCNDEERRRRLVSSRTNGAARYENSMDKTDDIMLPADFYFELQTG